jgi:AcrR family transcriptional regulator
MGVTEPAPGLRDRKKIRTRDTIRREAMRLIETNGYANTTIEQIAEASDISTSTFFRYFATKESALVANDLDQVTVEALEQQPANVPSLQAFRRAIEITMATVSADKWRFERARLKLVLSVPELKAAQFDEYHRTVAMLADAEARRIGRDRNDFEVHAFVGALSGAMMAVIEGPGDAEQRMYRALDFIEANMPLQTDGQ